MPFWPEMAFGPEMPFLTFWPFFSPDMATWQEMAMNQNWSNQLHFGQNGFSDRFFCSTKMSFWQKLLFSRKCLLAKNTFVKFEVAFWPEMTFLARNVFLPNWIKKSYFSKYWKVWLWKLSGLFLERFGWFLR